MHDLILEPARLTDFGRPILSSSQEVERFLYEGVSPAPKRSHCRCHIAWQSDE